MFGFIRLVSGMKCFLQLIFVGYCLNKLGCPNLASALTLRAVYPCNDSFPLNFQTRRWASDMKICPTTTWSWAHFISSAGYPNRPRGSLQRGFSQPFYIYNRTVLGNKFSKLDLYILFLHFPFLKYSEHVFIFTHCYPCCS